MFYGKKDIVERNFRVLKRDLKVMLMNVRKEGVVKEQPFVFYLSLILRMSLIKKIKDSGLIKK